MSQIEFDNFDVVLKECKELAKIKNKQYGVKNLFIFEGFGILTRMNDKMARLNNLFKIDISSTIRNNSTLQLTRFDFPLFTSRHKKAKDKMLDSNHYIVVKCKNYSWFDHETFGLEKQQYALVVTIWHESSNQIYNEVYQKIQIKEHVRELR